jgi:uncharacterized protein YndB with AHSA1/START domain
MRRTCRTVLRLLAILLAGSLISAPAAAERFIEKKVVIKASLDEAWNAWTTREGVVGFFAPEAEVDAKVGGAFHIYFDPKAEPGARGADDARFLALQPTRMLSFDWTAPPYLNEVRNQRTVVIVRFAAAGPKQTRVSLHHTGWGDGGQWDEAYAHNGRAWDSVLKNLVRRFEQGPIDWGERLRQLDQWREQAARAGSASAPQR